MQAQAKTRFKKTPIGEIPEDWEVVRVRKIFDVKTGTTPSTKQADYWENGEINWITPTDLSKLKDSIYIGDSERKITKRALEDYNLSLLPKGSLILSTRAPVGYVAVLTEEATFNQGCKGLVPKDQNKIISEFYAYYFKFRRQHLESLSGGSTFKELAKTMLERFQILFPPLSEQKKIAQILRTVNEAIEKTDLAIEKTERLKKGLMQRLLTKGIKHERFKKTEFGEIPEEWRVVKLKNIAKEFISGGTPFTKNSEYWNGNIPWIRSVHLTNYYIDESSIEQYITEKGLKNSSAKIVPKRNVIVATRVGIGKSAVNLIDVAINQDLTGIILDKSQVDPFFLVWYLQMPKILRLFESFSRGTTIKGIPQKHLRELYIPLPPLPEQKKITEILITVDKKLEFLKKRKEKLERIKKGLMKDLLTGRRRVKVG
ncbi:MAG: restriction endonuclease subunit S [Thermococcus sp.]|nr:restriction endonuclease subunit S [Thermococcus sp.]